MTATELEILVGTNFKYYEKRFAAIAEGRGIVHWNWAAFAFSSIWFIYRKIWLVVLPLFLASFVVVATQSTLYVMVFIVVAGLSLNVVGGLFGTWLYYRWLNMLHEYLRRRFTGEQLAKKLKTFGGVAH